MDHTPFTNEAFNKPNQPPPSQEEAKVAELEPLDDKLFKKIDD